MLTSIRSLLAATALAGTFAVAAPAFADDTAPPPAITVTGSVALVTDYRFRGISQSAGDPAIQGSININSKTGLYVGAWSSSIDFNNVGAGAFYGSQELDLYGGWTGEISPGLTADVGLLYYAYPGGHVGKAEFFEPYASLTKAIGPAKLKVGVTYAWSQDAILNDDNLYLYSNLDIAIPSTPLTISGHIGYQDGPLSANYLMTAGAKSHSFDYSIGASATVLGKVTLGVAYVGVQGPALDGFTDDTVVGTLSVSF